MRRGSAGRGLSTVVKGTPGFEHLETIAGKVRALGWHIVVHVNRADELTALAPRLIATGCPLVIDHIARVRREEGVASGGFQTLLQLLGEDLRAAPHVRPGYPVGRHAAAGAWRRRCPAGQGVVGQRLAAPEPV